MSTTVLHSVQQGDQDTSAGSAGDAVHLGTGIDAHDVTRADDDIMRGDAVETFYMNLWREGRIGCFSPVTYLDQRNITLIRPMIFATEDVYKRQVSVECTKSTRFARFGGKK